MSRLDQLPGELHYTIVDDCLNDLQQTFARRLAVRGRKAKSRAIIVVKQTIAECDTLDIVFPLASHHARSHVIWETMAASLRTEGCVGSGDAYTEGIFLSSYCHHHHLTLFSPKTPNQPYPCVHLSAEKL